MKLAVVAGGWHWPLHFYRCMAAQAAGADLFAISHRSPDLAIVREEKRETLETLPGDLGRLDRELYAEYASTASLKGLGWHYQDEANVCGDWGFLNQWLRSCDYRKYDVILFLHDDTYLRSGSELPSVHGDWLVMGHSRYPEAPLGYLRGSLEFFRSEMLYLVGGEIPLGDLKLTREGKTDSPEGMAALSSWNSTCDPLREFMVKRNLTGHISYVSPHYRVSPWAIEGERGLLSASGGAPWSFEAGLKAYPVDDDLPLLLLA